MVVAERIEILMKSLCSLFYLGSPDHKLMVEKCIEIGSKNSMEIYGYNISDGLWRPGGEKVRNADIDPIDMLNRILALNHGRFKNKRRLFTIQTASP